jgi:hypothetical protein
VCLPRCGENQPSAVTLRCPSRRGQPFAGSLVTLQLKLLMSEAENGETRSVPGILTLLVAVRTGLATPAPRPGRTWLDDLPSTRALLPTRTCSAKPRCSPDDALLLVLERQLFRLSTA